MVPCPHVKKWPKTANGPNLPHMTFLTLGSDTAADPARTAGLDDSFTGDATVGLP